MRIWIEHGFMAVVMAGMVGEAAVVTGCAEEEAAPGVITAAVQSEQPGVVELAARYYGNPAIARTSFAAAKLDVGCSGMMIGPTTLMTASHCGAGDYTAVTFTGYRGAASNFRSTETYTCRYLYQTFDDTDLTLLDCPAPVPDPWDPVPPGAPPPQAPGDIFGYVDFSPASPAMNQAVYSHWWNPLGNTGDHMFYSPGNVTDTTAGGWFVPDGGGEIGTDTSTYCEGGCSGSPQLDAQTHKILIGPTSTGCEDFSCRNALSATNYFIWGEVSETEPCDGCWTRNEPYITSLGLDPDEYLGWVDDEIDRLFDIQTDIESMRGETARKTYWLGFESPRRNQHWVRSGTTINAAAGTARIAVNAGAVNQVEVLGHHGLHGIAAAGTYRVRLSISVSVAGAGANLQVALRNNGTTRASMPIPLVVGGGFRTYTFALAPTMAVNQLSLLALGNMDVQVRNISVHTPSSSILSYGYANALELADERAMWRNGNDGSVAPIRPDGNGSSASNIAFAAYIERPTGVSSTSNWPLENLNVPMVQGRSHRICASHMAAYGSTFPPAAPWGVMQVRSGLGTPVTTATFRPGAAWTTTCTAWFTPAAGDFSVRFGTTWPAANVFANGKYLLDNLWVETTN